MDFELWEGKEIREVMGGGKGVHDRGGKGVHDRGGKGVHER